MITEQQPTFGLDRLYSLHQLAQHNCRLSLSNRAKDTLCIYVHEPCENGDGGVIWEFERKSERSLAFVCQGCGRARYSSGRNLFDIPELRE